MLFLFLHVDYPYSKFWWLWRLLLSRIHILFFNGPVSVSTIKSW
jgi:hypothetical protein